MPSPTTMRERFEELGFKNQAVIVGMKRVELVDFIESELSAQEVRVRETERNRISQDILAIMEDHVGVGSDAYGAARNYIAMFKRLCEYLSAPLPLRQGRT